MLHPSFNFTEVLIASSRDQTNFVYCRLVTRKILFLLIDLSLFSLQILLFLQFLLSVEDLVIILLLDLQLLLDQPSLHLLQCLLLQMNCQSCNEETLGGLWEIIHQLLFLLADVWGESCGAPVGFLECSTHHTSYFIYYCILHLV